MDPYLNCDSHCPAFLICFYLLTLVCSDLPSIGKFLFCCFSFHSLIFLWIQSGMLFFITVCDYTQTYWFFMINWMIFLWKISLFWVLVLLLVNSVWVPVNVYFHHGMLHSSSWFSAPCAAAIAMEIATLVCSRIHLIYVHLVSSSWEIEITFISQNCYFNLCYQKTVLICSFNTYLLDTAWNFSLILFKRINILFLRLILDRPVIFIAKGLLNLGNSC